MSKFRVAASVLLFLLSVFLFSSAFAIDKSPSKDEQETSAETVGSAAENTRAEQSGTTTGGNTTGSVLRTGRGVRLMSSFTVFLLAVFVGFEVINKVPPTLHTPLMSGSNAISGITIVGALLVAGHAKGGFGVFLGFVAVILAFINVVGGFLVTHRMLKMFKKR